MHDEQDDKPFDPSEQKLRRARDQGDIPRSTEANVALMYLGAWLAFGVGAAFAVRHWLSMASRAMGAEGWPLNSVAALAAGISIYAGVALVALAAVPAVIMVIGLIGQRALVFAPAKLAPDPNRVNPIRNFGQKFGKSGLVTFAISLAKVALVTIGGWFLFSALMGRLAATMRGTGTAWAAGLPLILGQVLVMALAISVVFAGVDTLWKRHEHRQKNRMSRKEMEDEYKESEGDPHLKAARRQRAVDIAMQQMLADVDRADVVIVNPTHYAVALEWKRGSGRAPVCLAKGVDEVAARIRERATRNRVPIWSDPPCARALHATVKIGAEIPPDQFAAVAAAIRFAQGLRDKVRLGW